LIRINGAMRQTIPGLQENMMTLRASAALLSLVLGCAQAASSLPALSADPHNTSVSGLSAGAFMAVQYQVAFSSEVVGAGIVAGGPYFCTAGIPLNGTACMQGPIVDPQQMVYWAQMFASGGQIDALSNLRNNRIYVFSGTKDTIVHAPAGDAAVAFFKAAGALPQNVKYVQDIPAGHALLTPAFGNDCAVNGAPYISHCTVKGKNYDQPAEILTHIYGKLKPRAASRSSQAVAFNQREFAPAYSSMAEEAFVYVPESCKQGGCKVHVALHGCKQAAIDVHDDFYDKSSYNDWADTNRLIVLYPQMAEPDNTNTCWDWIGYTGMYYATRYGTQLNAIHAMVKRLTSAPAPQVALTR
jgi:poly(3-hydroxybutyrate) depolymerase